MGRIQIKRKKKHTKKKKTTTNNFGLVSDVSGGSWVEHVCFEPIETAEDSDEQHDKVNTTASTSTISIVSWNVLAEAYCSRYSHVELPPLYQKVAFQPEKRKALLLRILRQLCTGTASGGESGGERRRSHTTTTTPIDVICLQEVDQTEIQQTMLELGYEGIETPRTVGGGAGGRTDACAIYVRSRAIIPSPSTTTTTQPEPTGLTTTTDSVETSAATIEPISSSNSITPEINGHAPIPRWRMVDHELLRLDDIATLSSTVSDDNTSSSSVSSGKNDTTDHSSIGKHNGNSSCTSPVNSNIQGMQMSFLRRNVAVLVRLRDTVTQQTLVIANAHLYWNPGFEYVKLCQAHYILKRLQLFQATPNEPVVFCGDLNSRPGGTTHSYLTNGYINAKRIAPWYALHQPIDGNDDDEDDLERSLADPVVSEDSSEGSENISADIKSETDDVLPKLFNGLSVFDGNTADEKDGNIPRMRYLLDASLNKLCRWLRILGQDAALETEEEEKLRTGKGDMVIFKRCVQERRTLVTTSPRLMQRRDCPSSVYCIHPPFLSKLEVALVHMLLSHGVVLEPSTFLGRCVVCNGNIVEEHNDEEKRRILNEYEAPPALIDTGMAVYECDGCKQGYWWNELPTSSASRVKTAATRLFELCVRGGVPVREDDDEDGLFAHVNVTELRKQGWDDATPGSELLRQRLDVVEWLKQEKLQCPFPLESAYALKSTQADGSKAVVGEVIPFTNVTHHFVDTLDYIFYDKRYLKTIERLHVPTNFRELGDGRVHIKNSHLLPSDVWPSDHLAIGARLAFFDAETVTGGGKAETTTAAQQNGIDKANTKEIALTRNLSDFPVPLKGQDIGVNLFCSPIGNEGTDIPIQHPTSKPVHTSRCGCGCVPAVPSLFEMAEMRKQARLEKRRLA